MPNTGQVNNSGGANGYAGPTGAETPYGAVKRLGQMTRGLPGAPGTNAPQQAKRAAQGQGSEGPPPATPGQAAAAAPTPYPAQIAQTWAALAALPGASPLVQMIAQEAQGGG